MMKKGKGFRDYTVKFNNFETELIEQIFLSYIENQELFGKELPEGTQVLINRYIQDALDIKDRILEAHKNVL